MAERPDYVAPQTVEGRVFAESGGRSAVVRIPLAQAGLDAARPHPVRLNLRVQHKDGGRSLWLPEHPLTLQDWVLAEKDLVNSLEADNLPK